jgi:hypothetical protein
MREKLLDPAVYERAVLSWPELVAAGKEAVSSRTRWRLPAETFGPRGGPPPVVRVP